MWKYALQTMNQNFELKNLFILYSKDDMSSEAYNDITSLTEENGIFTIVGQYMLSIDNFEQSFNAISKIRSACTDISIIYILSIDGCIIANLLERKYHNLLFSEYSNKNLDVNIFPIISFTLDEEIIGNNWSNVYL